MPNKKKKAGKRFTTKGHRMATKLKGKVRSPYAVVTARNHKKSLMFKPRKSKKRKTKR